jgi:hypothetical protein
MGHKLGWNVDNTQISHWDEIIADHFGQSRFPEEIVELLNALHLRDKEPIIECLDRVLVYLKNNIKTQFNTYKLLSVGETDLISINYPAKTYEFIFDLIKIHGITSVLDINSSVCGIGLKLAQDFPNIMVTLGCVTPDEVNDTRNIICNSVTYNTVISTTAVIEKHDLVLYGSIVYSLLENSKLQDLPKMIRCQTGKICLVEVPIRGDQLLSRLKIASCEHVSSPYAFRTFLCANRIKVSRCMYIDYGTRLTKRYLFVCS